MKPIKAETRAATPAPLVASDGAFATWAAWPENARRRLLVAGVYVSVLTVAFVRPLMQLVSLALHSELHSHILLIPVIVGYLVYSRPQWTCAEWRSSMGAAGSAVAASTIAVVAALTFRQSLSLNDSLTLLIAGYIGLIVAGGFWFVGARWMASIAFPLSFLVFMVPIPDRVVFWLEHGSVLASADMAEMMFRVTGTPLLRHGLIFAVPNIVFEVAQECSGIRSSLVLLITSLLASHLFLRTVSRRLILVLFVLPLAILRNGFRILVIGLLCVHIGPEMIDSVIHHRGGPIFFVLSLVPFFGVLSWLRAQERAIDNAVTRR